MTDARDIDWETLTSHAWQVRGLAQLGTPRPLADRSPSTRPAGPRVLPGRTPAQLMGLSRQITGNDKRGNSYDRRARRAFLLSPAAGYGGDGVKVPCWECGSLVNDETMCVDRIVPGELGGTSSASVLNTITLATGSTSVCR